MSPLATQEDRVTQQTATGTASERRLADLLHSTVRTDAISFRIQFPSGYAASIGIREPDFELQICNGRGLRAVQSMDELRICEAYMDGDLNLEGDLRSALELRGHLKDSNVWVTMWRYIQPMLYGRQKCNAEWVSAHYDADNVHLYFLDSTYHTYTSGVFEDEQEPLEVASERKLRLAFEGLGLKPGDRVLEPGPGWGSFIRYATQRGVYVKGITLSRHQLEHVNNLITTQHWSADVQYIDFFDYEPNEQFDAIVLNGVVEELRDFPAVMERLARWIKPGKRVYLDFLAATKHFVFPSFMSKYVYRGAVCRVHLPRFVDAATRSPFEILAIYNDRRNYYLTAKHWFENLENNREHVRTRYGERMYRLYRLYLGAARHMLENPTHVTTAYRVFLEMPADYQST